MQSLSEGALQLRRMGTVNSTKIVQRGTVLRKARNSHLRSTNTIFDVFQSFAYSKDVSVTSSYCLSSVRGWAESSALPLAHYIVDPFHALRSTGSSAPFPLHLRCNSLVAEG